MLLECSLAVTREVRKNAEPNLEAIIGLRLYVENLLSLPCSKILC